jgi:hypothetical protein
MENPTPQDHVSELHQLNEDALNTFLHLKREIAAFLPPHKRVVDALAAHEAAVRGAHSTSLLKVNAPPSTPPASAPKVPIAEVKVTPPAAPPAPEKAKEPAPEGMSRP